MSSQTLTILSRTKKKEGKYNILTFCTHERYESDICLTDHNFYAFSYENSKEWDTNYAKIPDNYYMLPKNQIPNGIQIDFIIAHSKWGQLQAAANISQNIKVPILCMEHTVPTPNMTNQQVEYMRSIKGHVNVFNTQYNKDVWNYDSDGIVAPHNVNTDIFSPLETGEREKHILSVANDYINRDYCLNFSGWQRITENLPTKVVGNTPGLSESAGSVEELADIYRNSLIFLNTSTFSPVPTAMLEAMACGCAVVTTATCEIPNIIENGVNGFASNNEQELKDCINDLLSNPDKAKQWGENARKTIAEKFSTKDFIDRWNDIFDRTYTNNIL